MADDTILAGDADDKAADDTAATDIADKAAKDDAGDKSADDKAADKSPDKGGDWRTELSEGDPELLKFLGRYHSKPAALKALKGVHDNIKSGKYRKPLGDDPTEDELKAYRKDFDVPDTPEGYFEKLPDGLVVGDDDKPIVEEFLTAMHGANAPSGVTAAAIQAYYGIVEKQEAEIAEKVSAAKRETEDALREEWGADYRRNVNITQSYLETLPEEVQDAIGAGFDGKGIPLGNNQAVLKWLASLALEANPVATVVPGAGANQASAIADEISQIEEVMRTNRAKYNRDEKMQARLRDLYAARDKLKGK